MDKETGFPEPGDKLTVGGDIIGAGRIFFRKDQKLEVEGIQCTETGKLDLIKIVDQLYWFHPNVFEETKHFNLKA